MPTTLVATSEGRAGLLAKYPIALRIRFASIEKKLSLKLASSEKCCLHGRGARASTVIFYLDVRVLSCSHRLRHHIIHARLA